MHSTGRGVTQPSDESSRLQEGGASSTEEVSVTAEEVQVDKDSTLENTDEAGAPIAQSPEQLDLAEKEKREKVEKYTYS